MKSTLLVTIGTLMTAVGATSQVMDASFGDNGIVVTEVTPAVDAITAMVLQTDGKMVALGFANSRMALLRYETNGSLDGTFGNAGMVSSNLLTGFGGPYRLKLQNDGKILVLCRDNSTMFLRRYDTNGALDTTFAGSGIANISTTLGNGAFSVSMELLPDGKIIITGYTGVNAFFLIKYAADGTLDTTFGTNGYTITQFPEMTIFPQDFCRMPDGSILVSSKKSNAFGYEDFALVKFEANGMLDTGFGTGGIVVTDIGGDIGSDAAGPIKLQLDGKILLSGISAAKFVLVRYNTDGSLDTTFNTTGIATINVGGPYRTCADMLIEPDGKILLAGSIGDDFAAVRYNANGSADASYGVGGIYKKDFGSSYDYGSSILRQPDGKYVMGGWTSFFCTDRAFALIRFNGPTLATDAHQMENSISISPNPTASFVTIKSNVPIGLVMLYDIQGRLLATSQMNSNEMTFNIEDKQNGVYFLKINTENGSRTERIVKN